MAGFDFDDLPEEQAEPVPPVKPAPPANAKSPSKPKRFKILDFIERSNKLPGRSMLPPVFEDNLPEPKQRLPRLYVIMIPGVSDHYIQGSYLIEHMAPENVELVVYEWPGLGFRKKEDFHTTLDDMAEDCFKALRKVMTGGPFILTAHSLGTRIMMKVAERAKRELCVEPQAVIALDCGAPHLGVFSEYGMMMLRTESKEWNRVWNYGASDAGASQSALDGLYSGFMFCNDIMPIGFHRFTCPVIVMIALNEYNTEVKFASRPVEDVEEIKKYTRTGNGCFADYPDAFTAWKDWADDLTLIEAKRHHLELKSSPEFLEKLLQVINDCLGVNK